MKLGRLVVAVTCLTALYSPVRAEMSMTPTAPMYATSPAGYSSPAYATSPSADATPITVNTPTPPANNTPAMMNGMVLPLEVAPSPRRKPVPIAVRLRIAFPFKNQAPVVATAGITDVNGMPVAGTVDARQLGNVTDEDGNVTLETSTALIFVLGEVDMIPGQMNSLKIKFQVNGYGPKVDGIKTITRDVMVVDENTTVDLDYTILTGS